MYRVLIADDEPWVAYGISKIIDWQEEGFEIAGEAHDGLSALEFIREQKPDIVISDIRMPGLDGIQLMDALRKEGIDAEIIIVSGYADFDYAKHAIQYGAFDYLLKQIDKQELLATVRRLRNKLEKKEKRPVSFDRVEDWFELMDSDPGVSVREFMLDKTDDLPYPHYRFISILFSDDHAAEGIAALLHSDEDLRAISFRTGQHKFTILMNVDRSQESRSLSNLFEYFADTYCRAGLSSYGEAGSSVSRLYQESDIALLSVFSMPEERIIEYRTCSIADEAGKMLLNMEAAIREQKPELIDRLLVRLAELCLSQPLYIDQIANIYNHIVALIFKYYPQRFGHGGIEFLTYDQIARLYRSPKQLFLELQPLFEISADFEAVVSNAQIKKLIEQIDARLSEDLTLSDMARQLNISIGYLSLLFKRETGMTYSEYVTRKRLDLAKLLLHDDSLSIQDVAERTGYKDYYHFNKLFKKHIGITPSKYRKL